jgi:hypothetical protein
MYPRNDRYGVPLDPRGPCQFAPGTPEKIVCMTERDDMGYSIWHPADKTFEDASKVTESTPGIPAYQLGDIDIRVSFQKCLNRSGARVASDRDGVPYGAY